MRIGVNKRVKSISFKAIGYVLGTSALAILWLSTYTLGLIAYSETFVANVLAMTAGLYVGSYIVIGGGLKRLLTTLLISFLAVIISEICFSFIHQFIALSISLVLLLVTTKYFLIKDHDSGWFGAVCAELMAVIFLFIIYVILGMAQLFLF